MNKSGNYLVTGRAGAGKTAITRELARLGYTSYDADDVPNLSSWYSLKTNEPIIFADNSYVDLTAYQWRWNTQVIQTLLDDATPLFLCGGAHNDIDCANMFDTHFVLDVLPEEQVRRVLTRTDNEYAKDPAMHTVIQKNQAQHLEKARRAGAVIIDANKPLDVVVNAILAYVHEN